MTHSPVTTEWLALPADIRSAAETAVGHLRPLTHAETLLIVGRAIKAERERCAGIIQARLPLYTEIGQRNALKECISSIKPAAVSEGGEDE